jgi:AmmeMemoRadiSam system protein A
MLTAEEKQQLLTIARESIAFAIRGKDYHLSVPPRGALAQPSGAFVTIRLHGELRGCIGFIESNEPLARVVAGVAVKAAFEDPRFPSLTPSEFNDISIEVSVLSPLRRVRDYAEIQVGVHGLVIDNGYRRGLLLPQVATEYGWDRDEFLENVARKAGLPRNAWKDPGTQLHMFSAEIAEEETASHG